MRQKNIDSLNSYSIFSKSVQKIYKNFCVSVAVIREVDYDIMDANVNQFDSHMHALHTMLLDIDNYWKTTVNIAVWKLLWFLLSKL